MAQDNPIDAVLNRLREALAGWLPPDPGGDLEERLTRAVNAGLERFQLVPKGEFDRQVQLVQRLEREVERLEARLAAIEAEQPSG